jgi:hypothetical protein
MSAPRQLIQDAEAIRYGFLSARTSDALSSVLQKNSATQEELEILEKAARFLRDISDGATFTVNGAFRQGAEPARSMAALDVALGPIDALRTLVRANNLAEFFNNLAQAVTVVKETGHAHDVQKPAREAQEFFEHLNSWLSQELRARRPIIGRRRGRAP